MSPDDKRHGTYAGAQAHTKAGEPPCAPCSEAKYLYTKRMRMRLRNGHKNRVPLGDNAWTVLTTLTATQISRVTGMNREMLYRLQGKDEGPQQIVLRSTRDKILSARTAPWTTIGIQRRAQALIALGYSATSIAATFGCHRDALLKLIGDDHRAFVRHEFAQLIVDAYDQLHMTPAPADRITSRMLTIAHERGYLPPLAWDDIDHDETPADLDDTSSIRSPHVDDVAVQRRMDGYKDQRLTIAEQVELWRRWEASGRSHNELLRVTGLRPQRLAEYAVLNGEAA